MSMRGRYNKDNQIRFKTSMFRSSICDSGDAYVLVKGTITFRNTAAQSQENSTANKKVIYKNCASLTNCISRINNMQEDNPHDIDVAMRQCIISENIVIVIQKHLKYYGNIAEMYRL